MVTLALHETARAAALFDGVGRGLAAFAGANITERLFLTVQEADVLGDGFDVNVDRVELVFLFFAERVAAVGIGSVQNRLGFLRQPAFLFEKVYFARHRSVPRRALEERP